MTTPPPLPSELEPAPRPVGTPPAGADGARGTWRTPFAWIALAAVALFMIGLQTFSPDPAPQPTTAATPTPAAPIEPEHDQTVMLKIVGKYAVGVKLLGASTPALAQGGTMNQLVGTIEDQAHTPVEKIRAAMLSAEIAEPDAALAQAEKLAADEALDAGLREDAALIVKALDPAKPTAREALSADDQSRLIKRHHWFAEVLLSRGLPETEQARAAILNDGRQALVVVIGAVAIVALAFFIGFILFALAAVLLITGQVRPAYRADARLDGTTAVHRAALIESLVLFIISLLVLGLIADLIETATGFNVSFGIMWLALPIALWPRLWGMPRAQWHRALGWHTGRGVITEIGAGIVGYLAALPIVAIGFATTVTLVLFTDAKPSHPVVEQAAVGGWWNSVSILILACLWAPICEETFFRGAMYAHCRRWMGPIVSALIIAFVFAAIHPQGWAVVPSLMSLAVGFALIREWRGSLIAPITAHAIQNGFVMTLNLMLLG
ncbi:MAG: lysostaphin resistance A-like protein [Phycisphaerales bacterium]